MNWLMNVEYTPTRNLSTARIEHYVKRRNTGSGFCFINGKRDVSFEFGRLETLKAAIKRLRKALGYRVSISKWKIEDDDYVPTPVRRRMARRTKR